MSVNSKNGYPEYIMRILRKKYRYDENDTSQDNFFLSKSKDFVLQEVLNYEGLLGGWHCTIKRYIKDIYGIDLDSVNDSCVIQAEWINHLDYKHERSGYFVCSSCNKMATRKTDYCPNCGAKMK